MFRKRLIVEIGGGHRPYSVSDVLVDKYLDNSERGGDIKIDERPLVIADIEDLPFKDSSFESSICSHVLEHAEDIEKAITELERISDRGYIETPSALFELVDPHRDYHNYLLMLKQDKLYLHKKEGLQIFKHTLLYNLLTYNLAFKLFWTTNQKLIKTFIDWKGKVPYVFSDKQFNPDDYNIYAGQSIKNLILTMLRRIKNKFCLKVYGFIRKKKKIKIEDLLVCSVCKKELLKQKNRLVCKNCAGYFPVQDNIYYLLPEYFKRYFNI